MSAEKRARELLVNVYDHKGLSNLADLIVRGHFNDPVIGGALEAIAAALTPQWAEISTAPRDGTPILIAGGTYEYDGYGPYPFLRVVIAYWYRDHWRGEDRQAHDEWYVHEPTHWLPLPAPPEGEV